MDALAAEIARKRKATADAKAALGAGGDSARKWVKKGDIEKVRVGKYLEEEERRAEAISKKSIVPQFRFVSGDATEGGSAAGDPALSGLADGSAEGSTAAAVERSGNEAGKAVKAGSAAEEHLKPTEVKRRLRGLAQPIQLFGETDEERLERYRAVSAALPSESVVNNELKAGQNIGLEHLGQGGGEPGEAGNAVVGKDEEDEDDELLAPSFVATTPEDIVSRHFKQLLKMWGDELSERPEAEAMSMAGRTATAAFQQAKRHMRPFFRFLKAREMPLDVLSAVVEITHFMQQREYVKAHDAYIKCAIGNAPWPMGITGTGIHERQGRQHVREDKIAHVMNDETQRKYLQSVKRLMTFAQRVLPPTGPSKTVR